MYLSLLMFSIFETLDLALALAALISLFLVFLFLLGFAFLFAYFVGFVLFHALTLGFLFSGNFLKWGMGGAGNMRYVEKGTLTYQFLIFPLILMGGLRRMSEKKRKNALLNFLILPLKWITPPVRVEDVLGEDIPKKSTRSGL